MQMVELSRCLLVAEKCAELWRLDGCHLQPRDGRLPRPAIHRAVLVEIDEQDARTFEGERGGNGGACRALADTALGGRKRDDHAKPQVWIGTNVDLGKWVVGAIEHFKGSGFVQSAN
jgi:hypothetical protein